MSFILSIGSVAVIYSAWYMGIPIFSLDWFSYCLSWIPLLIFFVSAHKYDKSKAGKKNILLKPLKNH